MIMDMKAQWTFDKGNMAFKLNSYFTLILE